MDQDAQITRVVAAYQFVAQSFGERVSIADIRLHLHNVGDVGPETLNPLLRELNGTVVDFYPSSDTNPDHGRLDLVEALGSATFRELDEGVEIDGVEHTHLTIWPC